MILAALGILFSCQRAELPEDDMALLPDSEVMGEATIRFSAMLPSDPATKAMGDAPIDGDNSDIKNMFLVIFDENGMLVEHREATNIALKAHEGHQYEASYEVTLTVTDQPRIIHFIANCPVEQITYGHETSIIGNMYVEKDQDLGTPETAYWARIKVNDLIVADAETDNAHFADDEVAQAFKCVPMLRNFAQINVKNVDQIQVPEGHTFEFLGFAVYNTVDMGTVAPYNKGTGTFQSFINLETNARYKYPDFLEMEHPYEGHALAAAELNQSLEIADPSSTNDKDKYKWYGPDDSFYMYERKISVKTADESKWNESPPHVIIMGEYDGQTCYYKVDLVYDVVENDKVSEIVYYNILRNFKYQFTLTKVANKGYPSVDEAIKGATSNNLAGSATTSEFTNISDNQGRMWVSYTDKMLVTNEDITLYYRYEPDLGSGKYNNNTKNQTNGLIEVVDLDGVSIEGSNVIKKITIAADDEKSGEWAGYRRIDIQVNDPQTKSKEQTIVIKSDQATLSRRVHYTLRQKFTLDVACTPKIEAVIGEPIQVDIILPVGLTESMFPLNLMVEVEDMTLSPNADINTIPVEIGTSTIPGKDKPAFYYVVTIAHKDEYDRLPSQGTNKVVSTYWMSNIANSASTVYVTNPYFYPDSAPFGNGMKFMDVKVNANEVFYGAGETVSISFTKSSYDNTFTNRTVTIKLNGLADANGNSTFTIKPTGNTHTIQNLVTTSLDGSVSFIVEENDYISTSSQTVPRHQGVFTDLKVGNGNDVPKGDGVKTSISFKMDESDVNFANKTVIVKLNGLISDTGKSEIELPLTGLTDRTVTINNLYTLYENRNVSFTVEEKYGTYATAESDVYGRRDRAFTDLGFGSNTLAPKAGETVDFYFTITEEEYVPDMTVEVTLEGLEPQSNAPGFSAATRAVPYTYTPTTFGVQTLKLQTTTAQPGSCSVQLRAVGFADSEVKTIEQKNLYNFTLSVPESVAQGTGKSVSISFTMDSDDTAYNGRTVTVKLVGMSRNGSTEFTQNVNNHNVTINNVVTTDATGVLSVTISADGYADLTVTCNNRPKETVTKTITFNAKFSWTGGSNSRPSSETVKNNIMISISEGNITKGTVSVNRSSNTFTITFKDAKIQNSTNDAEITITYSYSTYTYSKTIKVSELTANSTITLS